MTTDGADVDTAELGSYLGAELGVSVTEVEVLHDGLNLVLEISTENQEGAYVLRRPKKLRDTGYMNDVEAEYGVMQRLDGTAIPTPAPVLFCDDDSILGERFFVMTRLDGETIPLGADLPERFRTPGSRRDVAELVVDTLADIHSLDVDPFEDVCVCRTPREQVELNVHRLDETTDVTGHDLPTLLSVGEWLRRNAPSDPRATLVHGDFRPGNLLFAETDHPEVAAVLDWETAMLGDPLTELGYLLLRWRDDGDPTPSLDELEANYPNRDAIRELKEDNEHGLSPFTAKPGSPSRRELVARYEARTGFSFEDERFYRAHAAFSLAVVWEDLHRHRIEAGAESDWEPHIEYMSLIADGIASGEFPL